MDKFHFSTIIEARQLQAPWILVLAVVFSTLEIQIILSTHKRLVVKYTNSSNLQTHTGFDNLFIGGVPSFWLRAG